MKKKKITVFITAAIAAILVFTGCAAEEKAPPVSKVEEAEKPSKEFSLQDILNDSQSKLSEEEYEGIFAGNVFLSELSLRKAKKVEGDTIAPTVAIVNPKNNETISETKKISVFALDNVGVVKVEFYFDGKLLGEDVTSPFNYTLDTLSDDQKFENGTHTIKVTAYDAAGNSSSDSHKVKILNIQRLTLVKDGADYTRAKGNVVRRYRSYDKDDDAYYNIAHVGTYDNSAWVEYVFQLPYPKRYLYLDYNITVKEAEGSKNKTIAGDEPWYQYYNYALNDWIGFVDNEKSGQLRFWACEPYYNKVKIRIVVPAWSIAEIRKVEIGYRYLPDSDVPSLSDIGVVYNAPISSGGSGMWTNFVFLTNEDVFVTVEVRRPDGTYVQNVTAAWRNHVIWTPDNLHEWANLPLWSDGSRIAPPPGWNYGYCFVPWNQLDSNGNLVHGDLKYRISVKDTAGHSRTSSWYNFSLP